MVTELATRAPIVVTNTYRASSVQRFAFSYLSLSGGVQSSTIAEMMVLHVLPRVDAAIFVDLHDEPQYVYRQMEYLEERLLSASIPLIRIDGGNLIDDLYRIPRMPLPLFTRKTKSTAARTILRGRLPRQCTKNYKIRPIEKWIRRFLLAGGQARRYKNGRVHLQNGIEVQALLGISLDEFQRMKESRTPG